MNEIEHPTLAVERRDAIASLLVREGAARVSVLAEKFGVSPATVRRDLETLEDRGMVKRVHGGAVALDSGHNTESAPSSPRLEEPRSHLRQSVRIGRAVADMIGEDETVFLGPGSLSMEAARSLVDRKHITVITNGLSIAHWLAKHTEHRLIITGGQVEREDLGMVGQLARDSLSALRADQVILELDGVSAVEGLTQDSLPQAEIAERLMETGSRIVIMIRPERVGRVAASCIGPASRADTLVTAREAPSSYLWDLSEIGVEIVLA